MFRGVYYSRFGGPDPDGSMGSCPVEGCRYVFPVDLTDIAVERHASEHDAQAWRQVKVDLETKKQNKDREHESWVTKWNRDMDLLVRWLDSTVTRRG